MSISCHEFFFPTLTCIIESFYFFVHQCVCVHLERLRPTNFHFFSIVGAFPILSKYQYVQLAN